MLDAEFESDNAFTLADIRKPTIGEPNFSLTIAIREYGQVALVIPPSVLNPAQIALLNAGELGYPLTDFLGANLTVSGSFQRYRKTPTSAVSLQLLVDALAAV